MDAKRIIIFAVTGIVLASAAIWLATGMLGGPSTSVLEVDNPTDEQIAEIAALLLVDDESVRGRADRKLFDLGERALPVLRTFATEGHAQAGFALSLIHDLQPEMVLDVAEDLLGNPTMSVRALAVTFLSRHKDKPRTIELWVKALGDAEADIRVEATNYLRETPAPYRGIAMAGLEKLRNDPSDDVREKAAEAMSALVGRDVSSQFNVR